MIYLIYFIFLFIMITILFIVYIISVMTFKFHIPKYLQSPTVRIVEKAYKAVEFRGEFQYVTKDVLPYRFNDTDQVIIDDQHKKYIIDELTHSLAKQIMESGAVELKEEEDYYNPFRRRVSLRVKVYKPE